MDFVPPNKLVKIKPDTLEYVRKLYNLDKPGSMKEAVNILNEWVQKQPHFNKKDFITATRCLEVAIVLSKGSVERAKTQLDKMCTMRTLYPEFFGIFNPKTDCPGLFDMCHTVILPKLTKDHYRVYVTKFLNSEDYLQPLYYKYHITVAEYLKSHDYFCGVVMIVDVSISNFLSYIKKTDIIMMKKAINISIDGYGIRIKAIHVISDSKFLDNALAIVKPMLSAKIASRIHVHNSYEELHKIIPKEILPKDYGGEERSIKTLQEEWIEELSSEEHLSYLKVMNGATTNESCRQKSQFAEQYAGMPGTFRFLSVE
ncbi:alpha-tocopherol transfer protein-like [Bicyclus anynana]|uniref:Alpha-tocopherol transfer protein-like n=1 Tax=Bicyclus anynana TaxID=110368 RepID=A0A6J1P536_BICAN|nr:alpha-tocopherol transfer protein-like [Bicyclus anynana]